MTDETQTTAIQPLSRYSASPATSALALELAKCLRLVAPASMNADAQLIWIAAAVEALQGIAVSEVQAVSAELRRSVTRPAQIAPEISRLVADLRKRRHAGPVNETQRVERDIEIEAMDRRKRARTQQETEDAWQWERNARKNAGLALHPLAPPLSRAELDKLPADLVGLGLKCEFLERRDGNLHELSVV